MHQGFQQRLRQSKTPKPYSLQCCELNVCVYCYGCFVWQLVILGLSCGWESKYSLIVNGIRLTNCILINPWWWVTQSFRRIKLFHYSFTHYIYIFFLLLLHVFIQNLSWCKDLDDLLFLPSFKKDFGWFTVFILPSKEVSSWLSWFTELFLPFFKKDFDDVQYSSFLQKGFWWFTVLFLPSFLQNESWWFTALFLPSFLLCFGSSWGDPVQF